MAAATPAIRCRIVRPADRDRLECAGHDGHIVGAGGLAGSDLVTQTRKGRRRRAHEHDATSLHGFRERRLL